ncbi:lysocardiolipin acyltransferase 1 isoform X1 [Paralichthys olivaceus]|uniref:lysocardiolipin acyltransferase 1 isoform X1 n=1 Tax=Paralichthys olivaceus TaxID=8255 RepID=UPI003752ADD9
MAVSVRGLYFMVTLFLGSFFGSVFMLGPVLPLMLLSPAWYRWITDRIVATWLTLPVALLELVFGVKVVITGDGFIPGERSVIIMNHRTRLDWMFLWCCLLRYSYLRLEKICLKAVLKAVPGFGWAMQVACFVFIQRRWEADKKHLENMLDYFCDIREPLQLLLFPEGTDLTENTRAKSDLFAAQNNLPKCEFVLHPRTTGFTFIVDRLRKAITAPLESSCFPMSQLWQSSRVLKYHLWPRRLEPHPPWMLSMAPTLQAGDNLDAVHDITVAYPKNIPQTERHLILGLFPREIHFHVRRYPVASLPSSSELESWCRERWAEKEVRLRDFYSGQPRAFDREGVARVPPCKTEMRVALIKAASLLYWTCFIALCFTGLWLWAPFRLYCLVMVGVYMTQQKLVGGLELLELACHRYWKSMAADVGDKKKKMDEKMQ